MFCQNLDGKSYINESGFSEYETYGSFVDTRYPNFNIHKNWFSIRGGTVIFGTAKNLNENDTIWLSPDFLAVTFEAYDHLKEKYFVIFKNPQLQKQYSPNKMFSKFSHIIFTK